MIAKINVDVWLTCVIFLVEITLEEFDRFYYDNVTRISDEEYKRMRADIANPHSCNGFTMLTDRGTPIVYLRKGDSDLSVSHEIFHAANNILCRAGVNHDADAEPWAYLIGYLTDEYYEAYWDWQDNKIKQV